MREDGRRMSKSLGTGVDPMEIIQTIGADALRYTLLSQTGENQELRYSERKTEEARNFCNKIWNATRFVLMNIDGPVSKPETLTTVDKWLLSRLYQTEKAVKAAYDGYDVQSACQAMYRFFWSELCDWYIEVSKPRLNSPADKNTPQWVLLTAVDAFLRMMHPVMPHITEELYSHLPIEGKSDFIMSAPWPELPSSFEQPDAEAEIERIFEITRAFRALRAELDLQPIKTIPVAYIEGDLQGNQSVFTSQGWIQELLTGRPPEGRFVSTTVQNVNIHLPISGLVDTEKELARLNKEEEKAKADLAKIETRLSNPQFTERAKPEIVEKEQATLQALRDQLTRIAERRRLFEGM
jgi:valyl-tRNA synthetase